MLTHADKFPLTDKINNIHQTTEAILDHLDYRADDESRHKDTIQAICTLTQAVLLLAEIQLAIGVQP